MTKPTEHTDEDSPDHLPVVRHQHLDRLLPRRTEWLPIIWSVEMAGHAGGAYVDQDAAKLFDLG